MLQRYLDGGRQKPTRDVDVVEDQSHHLRELFKKDADTQTHGYYHGNEGEPCEEVEEVG
jgi:hypothetical protein